MPIEVIWDDAAKTIIRHVYSGELIPEDFYFAIEQSAEMTLSVDHTVHVIMDNLAVTKRFSGMLKIMREANKNIPPNQGIRVVLGASPMAKILMDVGKAIAPNLVNNVYTADTLEQARQIIRQNIAVLK